MSGLNTYNSAERQLSASVGYSILQAGVEGYLTTTTVTNATSLQDLIDSVNAAVVTPGAEAQAQRLNITRALTIGGQLGDLSTARVQASTTVQSLAENTWVDQDPAYTTGHLGVGIYG